MVQHSDQHQVPASSTQAFPHLDLLHDVCEHVRDDGVPPPPSFCGGRVRDRGKNVHDVHHNLCDRRVFCLRVCGHGCDPPCVSRMYDVCCI